jgi:hypothetical protein
VACSTCHTTPPRLNQTGYRSRAAGFRMPEAIGKEDTAPFDILNYISARVQFRAGLGRSRGDPAASTRHLFLLQALELYPLTGAWGKYFSSNINLTFAPVSSLVTPIENAYVKFNAGNEKRSVDALQRLRGAGRGAFEGVVPLPVRPRRLWRVQLGDIRNRRRVANAGSRLRRHYRARTRPLNSEPPRESPGRSGASPWSGSAAPWSTL